MAVRRIAATRAREAHCSTCTRGSDARTRLQAARVAEPRLDPFKTVFQPPDAPEATLLQPARYLHCAARNALPIAMLRSGYLCPLQGAAATPPPTDTPDCPCCGECVSRDGQAPSSREAPWLHICHCILSCSAASQTQRRLALDAFISALRTLCLLQSVAAAAVDDDDDGGALHWQTAVSPLLDALQHYAAGFTLPPADAFIVQETLLAFLMDPTGWRMPPRRWHSTLFQTTARLLRGALPPAKAGGDLISESDMDSDLYEDRDDVRVRVAQLSSGVLGGPAPPSVTCELRTHDGGAGASGGVGAQACEGAERAV